MSCGGREAVVYEARCKRCGAAADVTHIDYVQVVTRLESVARIVGRCTRCWHDGEVDALYGWCQGEGVDAC